MATRPNVVLVMCDDLGYGDVGFNSATHIQTPHLDALARRSVRFSRFYAGGPVCTEDPAQAHLRLRNAADAYGQSRLRTLSVAAAGAAAGVEWEEPVYEEVFHLEDDPGERRNLIGGGEIDEALLRQLRERCTLAGRAALGEATRPDTLPRR